MPTHRAVRQLRPATIRPVRDTDRAELGRFFEENDRPQVTRQFHPFPLDAQSAAKIVNPRWRDRFYVGTAGDPAHIVAFCMLRGWDEGYEVPSFGIMIDRRVYGHGLGRQMTEFAITEAARLGSTHVRLTVYASNGPAVHLYASLGFAEVERHDVTVDGEPDVRLTMMKRVGGRGR